MSRVRFTEDVKEYVIACYDGAERDPGVRVDHRVFTWQAENGARIKGKITPFTDHVCEKFRLPRYKSTESTINAILREAGEQIVERPRYVGHSCHTPRVPLTAPDGNGNGAEPPATEKRPEAPSHVAAGLSLLGDAFVAAGKALHRFAEAAQEKGF